MGGHGRLRDPGANRAHDALVAQRLAEHRDVGTLATAAARRFHDHGRACGAYNSGY